ncbi:hypothetical protein RvY_12869-2 [Ramazzottius varieornatus]|uniref:Fucosyltransferase N-terminal domain-containing protein n=1 Tax=Ramazzottius varieornatus TaxID=947166 RepID=A0A1D1VKZ4_RAMVA|nr:hypothetical protein RvY_12869-2 [Ramazzottius varieornatus]
MPVEVVRILGSPTIPRRMFLSRAFSKWAIGGVALLVLVLYILSIYAPSVSPLATSFLSSVDPLVSGITGEISARKMSSGSDVNLFPVDPASNKLVLFWTAFFSEPDSRGAMGRQLFAGCPINQCEATKDQGTLERSEAFRG